MVDRTKLRDAPERRSIAATEFELRARGDALRLTGYASMFGQHYDVLGGPPRGWSEVVDRRAFNVTLADRPDLHLLINHEGLPLARTKSGTLRVSTDTTGLHVEADLDPEDPDVQRLRTKMARRDMDEMSFAFRVKDDLWSDDLTERRLTEVSLHKGDVSVVNFGANPGTAAQLLHAVADLETAELRSLNPDDLKRARAKIAEVERETHRPSRISELRRVVAHREETGEEFDERAVDRGNITTPDAGDLNAAARRYAASQGWARDDGSYPIRPADNHGRADLDKAVNAVGRGDAPHDAIRRHIMRRARALGLTEMIPDNWNSDGSLED